MANSDKNVDLLKSLLKDSASGESSSYQSVPGKAMLELGVQGGRLHKKYKIYFKYEDTTQPFEKDRVCFDAHGCFSDREDVWEAALRVLLPKWEKIPKLQGRRTDGAGCPVGDALSGS